MSLSQAVSLGEWLSISYCIIESLDNYISDGVVGISKEKIETLVDLEDYTINLIDKNLPVNDFSTAKIYELPEDIKVNKNDWTLHLFVDENNSFNYFYIDLVCRNFDIAYTKLLENGKTGGYILLFYDENDELIALLPSELFNNQLSSNS